MHYRLCLITVCMQVLQNGRLTSFSKKTDCWCLFSWSICKQNSHFIRCPKQQFPRLWWHTHNGRTSSANRNSGQKPKLSERGRRTLKRIVTINHKVLQQRWQQNLIFILRPFAKKQSDEGVTKATSILELKLLKLWLLKTMLKGEKEAIWSEIHNTVRWVISFTMLPTSGRVYVWTSPKEAYNPECLVPTVKHGARSWWFGQQYLVFCRSCTYSEWSNYCQWLHGHFR